jgi:large subunit ribosomal protein L5
MAENQQAALTPRMKKHYEDVVRPAMIAEFGYKNAMEVPTIEKVVINMGVGEATADRKKVDNAAGDYFLSLLSVLGRQATITARIQNVWGTL